MTKIISQKPLLELELKQVEDGEDILVEDLGMKISLFEDRLEYKSKAVWKLYNEALGMIEDTPKLFDNKYCVRREDVGAISMYRNVRSGLFFIDITGLTIPFKSEGDASKIYETIKEWILRY